MAVRMIYTQYARRHDKTGINTASNASAPSYKEQEGDEKNAVVTNLSTDSLTSNTPAISAPIAIFPQYLTSDTTTLTIREDGFPSLGSSFSVTKDNTPIFTVDRERPSFRNRQHIIDASTQKPIYTVQRYIGNLARSFSFVDPNGTRIVDLQGNFFVPYTGAKSSAFLLSAETGEKVELMMHGSYRNRDAAITNKETGEVLVEMKSNIFELRNVVGGRRTYTVTIRAGLDMAMVVGLIIALDARAQ